MSKKRKAAVWILVALATLVTFISSFTVWSKRQLLDTNTWTDASGQMLQNASIRAALSQKLVDIIYSQTDVQAQLEQVLPKKLQPAAPEIAGALQSASGRAVDSLLQTAKAQALWEEVNRRAHTRLVAVLERKKVGAVSSANGDVTLDLGVLVQRVSDRLGVGGRVAAKLPPSSTQIVLVRSDQLSAAQDAVSIVKSLSVWLVVLALFLYGLAIYLAGGMRRTVLEASGASLVVVGLILVALRRVVENLLVDSLVKTEANRPPVRALWWIETTVLRDIAVALIAYGLLAMVAGFLAGPSRAATAVRRWFAPLWREHAIAVWSAGFVIFLLWISFGPSSATRRLFGTLVFAFLLGFALEVWRRQTLREFPAEPASAAPPPAAGPPPPAPPSETT